MFIFKGRYLLKFKSIKSSSIIGRTLSLYNHLDIFIRQNKESTCVANCNSCCNNYFYISEWEYYTLLFYVLSTYDDEYINSKIGYSIDCLDMIQNTYPDEAKRLDYNAKSSTTYSDYVCDNCDIIIRCPFLNEKGLCDIYEVRPLICRLYGTFMHASCQKINCANLISIEKFEYLNLIDELICPNGSFRKPYPIIDWLGSMTIKIISSGKFKKSYSADKVKFYY